MPLPEPILFTKSQLAKRWQCGVKRIDAYIDNGQLRYAYHTINPAFSALRQSHYYKCSSIANNLKAIANKRDLITIANNILSPFKEENIMPCPDFLYRAITPEAIFNPIDERDSNKIEDIGDLIETAYKTYIAVKSDADYIQFRYYHNRNGDILIPIKKEKGIWQTYFPLIEKQSANDFVIPLEEIERFEIGNNSKRKKKAPSVLKQRKADILSLIKEKDIDPLLFPKAPLGKAGAKAEIRALYLERFGKTQRNPFDKAWEALRKEGLIKDKND